MLGRDVGDNKMTKKKFPERVVLGVGYPWIFIDDNYKLWLTNDIYDKGNKVNYDKDNKVKLNWPSELDGFDHPQYRLILERVDE